MTSLQQYFIGLPVSRYEDFKSIIDRILSGSMMTEPRPELEEVSDIDSDDESPSISPHSTVQGESSAQNMEVQEILDILHALEANRQPGDEHQIELLTQQLHVLLN